MAPERATRPSESSALPRLSSSMTQHLRLGCSAKDEGHLQYPGVVVLESHHFKHLTSQHAAVTLAEQGSQEKDNIKHKLQMRRGAPQKEGSPAEGGEPRRRRGAPQKEGSPAEGGEPRRRRGAHFIQQHAKYLNTQTGHLEGKT